MHKSKSAAFDLINETRNNSLTENYDIICIQEPWQDSYGNVKRGARWELLHPTSRPALPEAIKTRSVILVNKSLASDSWQQVDIPNTNDVTAVRLSGEYGSLLVVNVYNDINHNHTIHLLKHELHKPNPDRH
ncbi:hypothetical protein MPER_11316, partial [Moniliophthora perniciosa FA553]